MNITEILTAAETGAIDAWGKGSLIRGFLGVLPQAFGLIAAALHPDPTELGTRFFSVLGGGVLRLGVLQGIWLGQAGLGAVTGVAVRILGCQTAFDHPAIQFLYGLELQVVAVIGAYHGLCFASEAIRGVLGRHLFRFRNGAAAVEF